MTRVVLVVAGALFVAGCGTGTHVRITGPRKPDPQVTSQFFVSRPRATRAPTSPERTAIVAATRSAHHLAGHDACLRYRVRVSGVDPRFAEVEYAVVTQNDPHCTIGNGITIMWKPAARWRVKGDASSGFPCGYAPAGVIASLEGACSVDITNASRPDATSVARIRQALEHSRAVAKLHRRRLRLEDVWMSRSRDLAVGWLSGGANSTASWEVALVRRGTWRTAGVGATLDFCRFTPADDLRELNLRC